MFKNTVTITAITVATYEIGTRWREAQTIGEAGANYWRNYFPPEVGQRADSIRETHAIRSTGVTLHIDVYPQSDRGAPVVVFNHGGGSYSRLATKLCLSLRERGYTVVAADQKGQGFSGGQRGFGTFSESVQMAFYNQGYTVVAGDRRGQGLSGGKRGFTTLSQEIQNVIDITRWSQQTFQQPHFMTGCSMGGPLTYYAAAAGAPVNAVSCFNLYDFTPGAPDIPEIFGPGAVLIDRLWPLLQTLGWLSLPWHLLNQRAWKIGIDDREPQIQAIWEKDPLLIRLVPLTFIHALTATAPAVPFEQNQLPVQVINPNRDRMSDPAITQRNYERLGGPKHYAEVPYGHYAFAEGFGRSIAEAADPWFKQHGLEKARGK